MSQDNSDKDKTKSNSPFPSGPSAPKPDWLKDVEDDAESTAESETTSTSESDAPEGLRETQPIDSEKVGKPASEADTTEESKADNAGSEREEKVPPTEQTSVDTVSEKESPDRRRSETSPAEEADDGSADIEEADSSSHIDSEDTSFESQTLAKESRSTDFRQPAGSAKISVSESAGATERPGLPASLVQTGAVFIAGTGLLSLVGLTLNLGSFGITATNAGFIGLIYGIAAVAIERLQKNSWLPDLLLVLGLAITIGVASGPLGLNAFSIGSGFVVIGIILSILDRV